MVGTVTTGAAGTDAMVTRTGPDNAPVFNFTIPRGATGTATFDLLITEGDGTQAMVDEAQLLMPANRLATSAYVDAEITDEANTRSAADNTLQTNINNEETAREAADMTLTTNLATEVTNRTDADTALGTRIDTEATTRGDADTALGTRIDGVVTDLATETTNRTTADTALQSDIDDRLEIPAGTDTIPDGRLAFVTVNNANASGHAEFDGIFSTIVASAAAITPDNMNVVSENTTDTLTFVAGEGISIQTDSASDSIIITNTGGGGTTGFTARLVGATTMTATNAVTYNLSLQAQAGFTYDFTAVSADGGSFTAGIVSAGQTVRVQHPAIAAGGATATHTYTLTYVATPDGGTAQPAETLSVTLTATAPPAPPTQDDFVYTGHFAIGATDPVTTAIPQANIFGTGNPAAAGTSATRAERTGATLTFTQAASSDGILFMAIPTSLGTPTFLQTRPSMFEITADATETYTVNSIAYTAYKIITNRNITIEITF